MIDHNPGLQDEVRVDGRPWVVVAEEDGTTPEDVLKRYVAQPAG